MWIQASLILNMVIQLPQNHLLKKKIIQSPVYWLHTLFKISFPLYVVLLPDPLFYSTGLFI